MTGTPDRTADVLLVQRPWGQFVQFVANEPVTVKTIALHPGHRLSLQRHRHRAELWHVLDGPVQVTVDDRTWSAEPGELVWVPRGAVHRLANPGSGRARVLEIAFGQFAEDDIERLEDDYRRA